MSSAATDGWTPELRRLERKYDEAKHAAYVAHDGFEAGLIRAAQEAWERFSAAVSAASSSGREVSGEGPMISRPDAPAAPPDFDALGITDNCSRCGRPYDEHPHAFGEDCVIGNPHAFRSQPLPDRGGSEPWFWPDGRFESWHT